MPISAPLTIAFYLGAEEPCLQVLDVLLTIANDHGIIQRLSLKTPAVNMSLPFHDGPCDAYRLVAHVEGFHDCGGFVRADPHTHKTVSMLLIPRAAKLRFPAWALLTKKFTATANLMGAGVDAAIAEARYTGLATQKPLALASLMNLSAAMQRLVIGGQQTPLSFIREIVWDDTLAQDRFFAYADSALVPLVRAAAQEGEFTEELHSGVLHPGATSSYKQSQYAYSNVQLTFHEKDRKQISGVQCILIEPDMDCSRNRLHMD